MTEQRFCPECGNEIVFDYTYPTKSFRIDEYGNILRDDNNDAFCPEGDNPYIVFYCSNDREHDLGSSKEQLDWEAIVEQEFKDRGCYDH